MNEFPERFFSAVVPFLRGEQSVEELCCELGASQSGPARLQYYRTLMTRNVSLILTSLYPTIRRLCELKNKALFFELAAEYDRVHPAAHFEPNQFGRHFSEFLQSRREEFGLPLFCEDIADYEWCLYAVGITKTFVEPLGYQELQVAQASVDAPVHENPFVVRQYECDVIDVVKRCHAGEADLKLGETPCSVVLYRDASRGTGRAFKATTVDLIALARRTNPEFLTPLALRESDLLKEAEERLEQRGLFVAPASIAPS